MSFRLGDRVKSVVTGCVGKVIAIDRQTPVMFEVLWDDERHMSGYLDADLELIDELPISIARNIAEDWGQRQVIVVTWDGSASHCVTYGVSVEDCDRAAQGGDRVKAALGWSEDTMGQLPNRVQELYRQLDAAHRETIEAHQRTLAVQQELREAQDQSKLWQEAYDRVPRGPQ